MPNLADLPTPCAIVDLAVARRNSLRMAEKAARLGVRLRPHAKTHKTVEGARLQTAGGDGALTVSTLAEARFFADAGFRDLTYAVPLAPAKLPAAIEIGRRLEAFHLLVDGEDAAKAAAAAAKAAGVTLSLFLKVDCGTHRAGVDPESPESPRLADRIATTPGLRFAGLLAHAGHSYGCRGREELQAVAEEERRVTAGFAERLRQAGIEVPVVSIGSTPTMAVAEDLTGIDEVRPGNYFFFDRFQAVLGSCAEEDVAFSVLAAVIGCHPRRRHLVLDAGALALSKDRGPTHLEQTTLYGTLRGLGGEALPGLRVISLSQEHAVVECADAELCRSFPVGTRLAVLPNHSCLAAALFDEYHVLEQGEVVERWRPVRGW